MSNGDDACTTNLQATDMVGLTIMSEAAFLSMGADVLVLGLILGRVIRHRKRPGWRLIQTPLDLYVLSLIASDLMQALGEALSVRWIQKQQVYCSVFCSAQGAIELIGETSSAMATIAISVYTFLKIAFRLKLRYNWVPKAVVCMIWLYVILFASIGAGIHHLSSRDGKGNFNEPTPYWCWVSGRFAKERVAGEYIWLWIGGLSSIFLYVPLYFIAGGNFNLDRTARFGVRLRARGEAHGSGGVPFRILLYPVSYTILVLPLSIARWRFFRGGSEPSAVVFFAISLYQLSGFVNVLLLFYTRGSINLLSDDLEENLSTEMELGSGKQHPDAHQGHSRDSAVEPMEADGGGLPD